MQTKDRMYPMRLFAILTLGIGLTVLPAGCGGGGQDPDGVAQEKDGKEGMIGVRNIRRAFRGRQTEEPDTTTPDNLFPDDPYPTPFGTGVDDLDPRVREALTSHDDPDFDEAIRLVQADNFVQARSLFLNITKRNPANDDAWRWLGDCNYNLMELHKALEAYQEARRLNPRNYFAQRGEGLTRLHYGHELWRTRKQREAHEQYRQSIEILQNCTRLYPGDMDAMYGRAMAAEGASRLLYMNAILLLSRREPQLAETELRNCLDVILEGVQAAEVVTRSMTESGNEIGSVGPLNISGGLYQRHAMLLHTFKRDNDALQSMHLAAERYRMILRIDPTNLKAQEELNRCLAKLEEWAQAR